MLPWEPVTTCKPYNIISIMHCDLFLRIPFRKQSFSSIKSDNGQHSQILPTSIYQIDIHNSRFYPYNFRIEVSILDNCEGEDFAIVCQLIFDLIFLTGFEPDLEGFISRLTFSSPKNFASSSRVKSQLISKGLFDFIVWTIKLTNFFKDFYPSR